MAQHKDFLGKDLNVGDEIVAMERYSSGSSTTNKRLVRRTITRMTSKMIVYDEYGPGRVRRLFPKDCIKVPMDA